MSNFIERFERAVERIAAPVVVLIVAALAISLFASGL